MPAHYCKHPTCRRLLSRPGYCPAHASAKPPDERQSRRRYDEQRSTAELRRFYGSKAWQATRAAYAAEHPVCEICLQRPTADVHHKVKVAANLSLGLEWSNLLATCRPCHARAEGKAPSPAPSQL